MADLTPTMRLDILQYPSLATVPLWPQEAARRQIEP